MNHLYYLSYILLGFGVGVQITDMDNGRYAHSSRNLILASISMTILIYCVYH